MNYSNSLHAVTIDTRLHRATVIDPACATEGGEPHEPPLAKPSRVRRDDSTPQGYFWWWLALAIDLVAAIALLVIVLGPK